MKPKAGSNIRRKKTRRRRVHTLRRKRSASGISRRRKTAFGSRRLRRSPIAAPPLPVSPTAGNQNASDGEPVVSVIVPAMNERRTIAAVVREAFRVHPQTEVIVVANGSTDGTAEIAERHGAKVIRYPEPLGHDVGRSLGAKKARGRILLFADGDIVVPAKDLTPLVRAVENGVDVALNEYLGPTAKKQVHGVILAKHALNIALCRPELRGASMTTVPHAMSRRALETIGHEQLAVPPKAQAAAVFKGLDVRAVHYIEVGKTNPRRRRTKGSDPLESLIIGDHLEALDWYFRQTGDRGSLPDTTRLRELAR